MSDPKQVLISGDVNIQAPESTTEGVGSLYISSPNSVLDVEGETFLDKTNIKTDDGQFRVDGTNKVSFDVTSNVEIMASASSFFKTSAGALDVEAQEGALSLTGNSAVLVSDTTTVGITGATGVTVTSQANNVTINPNVNLDVNAGSAITLDANASSNFTVTGSGNLTNESTAGRVIINAGSANSNAVTIAAGNAAGGVAVTAGSGGFDVIATDGPFSIDGQNSASNISLATNANNQDFTIAVTGVSDSSLVLSSTGTAADAIKITSGSGSTGGVDLDAGSSGIDMLTTGPVSIDAEGTSNFTTTGAFDLTVESTAGSVNILGGEAAADAVKITAGDVAGGIDINAGSGGVTVDTTAGFSIDSATTSNITLTGTDTLTINNTGGQIVAQSAKAAADAVYIYASNAAGGVTVNSGTGGFLATSQGEVSIDGTGSAGNLSIATNADAQDLTISVTGNTDSSVIISSTGTGNDAVKLLASAGGIKGNAVGPIALDTTDLVNGVSIATATNGVPVTIGTATSLTTIAGDLTVSGTTTTINTEVLVVEDNVIIVNASNGELGNDGGMLVRRNQTPNDAGSGDVASDTGLGKISSTFQAGSATPGTLVLNSGASAVDDFYAGWWIKITSGAGANQVRRIATYDGTTKEATIYVTADNVAPFADGLDLATAPASGVTYDLFNSPYSASFYDESADKWVLGFTNTVVDAVSAPGSSVVNIQRYAAVDTGAITVQANGDPNSSTINVNFINEQTSDLGVTIEGLNINNGLINGASQPISEVVTLLDNSTSGVNIPSTTTMGAYSLLVVPVQGASGPSSYLIQSGGACATFSAASSGTGGALNRTSASRGSGLERIDITWNTGEKIKLRHFPAKLLGTGANVYYRVLVTNVL